MRYRVEVDVEIGSMNVTVTKWFKEGTDLFHREKDLPAYEVSNAYKAWYLNGILHRENGPAVIHSNGKEEYALDNVYLSKEEWTRRTSKKDSCEGKIVEIDGKKYKLTSM
jgi:hypothetical protein